MIIRSSEMSNTIPDQKVTATFLVRFCLKVVIGLIGMSLALLTILPKRVGFQYLLFCYFLLELRDVNVLGNVQI